jgi:hypothetical protein
MDRKDAYRVLVGKPERKCFFVRLMYKSENNIKMNLAQDRIIGGML